MSELTNEEVARRYFEAATRNDLDALEALRADDWEMRWPATGELVRSSAAYRAIHERFPGGYPHIDALRIIGSEDRYVVTPANTVVRLAGSGDVWIGQGRLRYGDGSEWYFVKLVELRDGRIRRETDYWSPVTDPPAWRAGMADRLPTTDDPHRA